MQRSMLMLLLAFVVITPGVMAQEETPYNPLVGMKALEVGDWAIYETQSNMRMAYQVVAIDDIGVTFQIYCCIGDMDPMPNSELTMNFADYEPVEASGEEEGATGGYADQEIRFETVEVAGLELECMIIEAGGSRTVLCEAIGFNGGLVLSESEGRVNLKLAALGHGDIEW